MVWFGEALDPQVLRAVDSALLECDLCLLVSICDTVTLLARCGTVWGCHGSLALLPRLQNACHRAYLFPVTSLIPRKVLVT